MNLLFFVLKIFEFITSVCKTLNYFLLLCFCFKNLDLFDQWTTQFDFSLSTLACGLCGLKLCVKSLHPKKYVVPSSSSVFFGFIFDCVFFILFNLVKKILKIHFKYFDLLILSFDFFISSSNSFILFSFFHFLLLFAFKFTNKYRVSQKKLKT